MNELYYLADQDGPINGAKCPVGFFATPAECHARALADGVAHYSIEWEDEEQGIYEIIFIC